MTVTKARSQILDLEINEERQHKVLDHGMIRVVDYMGNDSAIVQAARVSYGEGTTKPSDDRSLIRYLMSHRHSTPFEMCEIKLHVKLPVFVARQWIRHRTANVNEYSARYSILANEFYVPERRDVQPQSTVNKQGRDGALPEEVAMAMIESIRQHSEGSYQLYEELLSGWPWFNKHGEQYDIPQGSGFIEGRDPHNEQYGMAREMARMVCPPNIYTEWYWKIDLHNLLHFLSLRADPHAQMEIRAYAEVICDLVREWCPMAYEAFEDYVLEGERFSRMELDALRSLLSTVSPSQGSVALFGNEGMKQMNTREQGEFFKKLGVAFV